MEIELVRPADPTSLEERRFEEAESKFRTSSQRDRDRVLYSSAFQRLAGVTQVASPEVGHVFHSRLTHSLKVAQVARRLAERLKDPEETSSEVVRTYLDPDAVEASALAHDFGHPPFGHLAEKELDRLAGPVGGFEGNAQTFRILTRLASRSVDSPGLNLTRRVLTGTIKYPNVKALSSGDMPQPEQVEKAGAYEDDKEYFSWAREISDDHQTLEAALMDWADDVTYAVHDMDDFYRAGLIPLDRLCELDKELKGLKDYLAEKVPEQEEALWAASQGLFRQLLSIDTRYSGIEEERVALRALGSALITRYINAVTVEDRGSAGWCLIIPNAYKHEVEVLKMLTWKYVIERPSLAIIQTGHRRVISELFDMYCKAAEDETYAIFPPAYAERLETGEPANIVRAVVDLVASLSEAGALEIYRRISAMRTGSVVDATGEYT